ncbi:MAG: glucose-1-phosphate thymidylyltransferase, partial [Candidatus Hydrogenedentes bacterium]|nr:glucose-1-phosphate thymidylyltransferase [Candidatus Hydrogenedentota bacterium]
MNYILFDGTVRNALLPFTFTRPVADIRVGILTIREKWEKYLGYTTTSLTEEYLMEKFPMVEMPENIMINASFLPNEVLAEMVKSLEQNQAIFKGEEVIAFFSEESQEEVDFENYEILEYNDDCITIEHTWDIFQKNDAALREDFELL